MKEKLKLTEMLLYLDILAYFPEFARNGYGTVGEFIDDYLAAAPADRPSTMFSSYKNDEEAGVLRLIKYLSRIRRIMDLEICLDSSDTNKYAAVCIKEDMISSTGKTVRNVFIILGANYREGLYESCYGTTSTWSDNFTGAVQSDTAEQKSILKFYDKAAASAPKGLDGDDGYRIIVSGHSKAGNLAQYIAVMRDNVDRCYSFDGQGFSDKFLKKYRSQIKKNGPKIVSICPDMSMAGSLLHALPNSHKRYIYTGYLRDKTIPLIPLFCHMPTALLDNRFKLKSYTGGFNSISDLLHLISVCGAKAAAVTPFVNAEKGLAGIGESIRHLFKGRNKQAAESFFNRDPVIVSLMGLIIAALASPVYAASELINAGSYSYFDPVGVKVTKMKLDLLPDMCYDNSITTEQEQQK